MPKHLLAHPRTIVVCLGGCLLLATSWTRVSGWLTPLLVTWLTATVYTAGLALILVAFGYCYRPAAWLRTLAQCAVVAAVAMALAAVVIAWRGRGPRRIPCPPPPSGKESEIRS